MHLKKKKLEGSDVGRKILLMSMGIILYHIIIGRIGIVHKEYRHDTCFEKYSGACIRVFQKSFIKTVLGTGVILKNCLKAGITSYRVNISTTVSLNIELPL